MVKVDVQPDCGNAPKKLFIRDFMIAFANGDSPALLDCVTDDATWEIVGERTLKNKTEIESALDKMLPATVKAMTLMSIITHGDEGSVNGIMTLTDDKHYGFCHVYTFNSHGKNAKVKQILSYVIEELDRG
ncbi:MAG: nuclear transport factor 2 family protein [Anaerolineae bacterium]|nr:nuclear transport factor 2 family protein [Anaerolineae bacterium]